MSAVDTVNLCPIWHVGVVCTLEDVMPAEPLRLNPKADLDLLRYGYLRGAPLHTEIRNLSADIDNVACLCYLLQV
jgi:hypothetical protein